MKILLSEMITAVRNASGQKSHQIVCFYLNILVQLIIKSVVAASFLAIRDNQIVDLEPNEQSSNFLNFGP